MVELVIVMALWEPDGTFSEEELNHVLEQGGHCGYVFISAESFIRQR